MTLLYGYSGAGTLSQTSWVYFEWLNNTAVKSFKIYCINKRVDLKIVNICNKVNNLVSKQGCLKSRASQVVMSNKRVLFKQVSLPVQTPVIRKVSTTARLIFDLTWYF